MHSFKEFNKKYISQVFSDTIQKCMCIVKYYTPQVCIAQNGVKYIQAAGYNGVCTVDNSFKVEFTRTC